MAALGRRGLLALLGSLPLAGRAASARAQPAKARAPVPLIYAKVNGEDYYQMAQSVRTLEVGEPLVLRREPGNPHDRRAIEVLDARGLKLGYVPRVDNSAVARMMDAGEAMQARVTSVCRDRRWCEVRFAIEWLPA